MVGVGRPKAPFLLAVAALLLGGCLAPSLETEANDWPTERPQRVPRGPSPRFDWPDDPNWTAPAPRASVSSTSGPATAASWDSTAPDPYAETSTTSSAPATWTRATRTSSSRTSTAAAKPWSNWEAERDAHGPAGLAATIDLTGDGTRLEGPMELRPARLHLVPAPLFPDNARLTFIDQATVDGLGSGLVILEGHANVSAAAPVRLAADGVTLEAESVASPVFTFGGLPEPTVPDDWSAARRSAFFADGASLALDHATVTGFTRGLLVQGNQSTPLSGPIVVSAASIHWADGSTARFARAELAPSGGFSFAGVASGEVRPEGRDAITDVRGFVASGGALQLDGARLRDAGGVRVTQVVTGSGFALPATVQIISEKSAVTVARNGTAWVLLHFRESGFAGDAVLASVEVTGNGSQAVELPLRAPPGPVDDLFSILNATSALPPPFNAFLAVGLVVGVGLTAPFVAFAETMSCLFGGCPWKSTYPSYMGAGQVGTAYLKVHPDLPPGTYDLTVRLHGANHEPASFPLQVTVT